MQRVFNIHSFLTKKQQNKDKEDKDKKQALEKHREIYNLFVKSTSQEEIQELERWLIK